MLLGDNYESSPIRETPKGFAQTDRPNSSRKKKRIQLRSKENNPNNNKIGAYNMPSQFSK